MITNHLADVTILIRQNSTGKIVKHKEDSVYGESLEGGIELLEFIWSEGNSACDCSRSEYFEFPQDECSHGNYSVKVSVNGTVILDELGEPRMSTQHLLNKMGLASVPRLKNTSSSQPDIENDPKVIAECHGWAKADGHRKERMEENKAPTAHEIARALLDGPDVQCVVYQSEWGYWAQVTAITQAPGYGFLHGGIKDKPAIYIQSESDFN